ncbi:dnaJ homolog subfamily C member 28-like [Ptychodera flava]|uniref:dnaJ homolog subfamily C member 28-like n=1 Tax=Ptychodera flava TaxID=63121 RepID=UPI003969E24D
MSAMGNMVSHMATLSKKDRDEQSRQVDRASSAALDYLKVKMSEEPEEVQIGKYFGKPVSGIAVVMGGGNVERVVEGIVANSVRKGEFDKIIGAGKRLTEHYENPYINSVDQRLNQILINNNYTTDWIELRKNGRGKLADAKKALKKARECFKKEPSTPEETKTWKKAVETFRHEVKEINEIISEYNLATPTLFLQLGYLNADRMIQEIYDQSTHE